MDALMLINQYGPEIVAALGGAAGIGKGGAWVVGKVLDRQKQLAAEKEAVEKTKAAEKALLEEIRAGLRACTEAVGKLSLRVDGFAHQLNEHDARTAETAKLVQNAREDLAELRGEVLHRLSRAENDASTARHVANEANALATNAHHRLDTEPVVGPFGRPVSKPGG